MIAKILSCLAQVCRGHPLCLVSSMLDCHFQLQAKHVCHQIFVLRWTAASHFWSVPEFQNRRKKKKRWVLTCPEFWCVSDANISGQASSTSCCWGDPSLPWQYRGANSWIVFAHVQILVQGTARLKGSRIESVLVTGLKSPSFSSELTCLAGRFWWGPRSRWARHDSLCLHSFRSYTEGLNGALEFTWFWEWWWFEIF